MKTIYRRYRTNALVPVLFGALLIVTPPALYGAPLQGDFNGDGFSDLAIGVPWENIGTVNDAGAVNVLYGSATGLTATANQFWSQDSPGILGSAGVSNYFGTSLAVGDFNGDGFSDLATGVPGETIGTLSGAGAVNILYGSATGLTATGNQFWSQNSAGVLDAAEVGDGFGESLAVGDFDHDGFADLAIAVFGESVGTVGDAGAVHVLYGSVTGLTATNDQIWSQDSPGIANAVEEGDFFGSPLAVGDFNGDKFADLAIGVSRQDIEIYSDAGAVHVLYGSATRLSAVNSQFWSQNTSGILDTAYLDDHFGFSLVVGNFDGDGFADLAIGVEGEHVVTVGRAGAVNVLYGTGAGLSATRNQFWSQDSTGIVEAAEGGDFFGGSLAAGDFDGDGFADLAVGVPLEHVGTVRDTGGVNVLYGGAAGLSATGNQFWSQNNSGVLDTAEPDEYFGYSLAVRDFNGDGFADLVVGVPAEGVGTVVNTGGVNVLYGRAPGLSATGNQFWSQNSLGVLDAAEVSDAFGQSL